MSAVYAIGDVQGCCASLNQLLESLPDHTNIETRFWFAGDLINRGPQSLQALRTIKALSPRSVCVLGNHDLHLLAAAAGVRQPSSRDTLDEILQAPDRDELIDWLRRQPLAWHDGSFLMAHAGVHPEWSIEQTLSNAAEVERALQSADWKDFLTEMYGNQPDRWDNQLSGNERLRATVNVLTRMRMLDNDMHLDMKFKDNPAAAPACLSAWFTKPNRLPDDVTVIFGHWSTLGLLITDRLISLDTGCVWGGKLSAVRLSDRALFQVDCPPA